MSLGSVLLQPQVLAAARRPLDERPPNALLDLLTRLASEIASGGKGLTIIEDEFTASFETLAAEVEPRLGAARTRLERLVEPLLVLVEDTLGDKSEGEGFERAVNTGKAFSNALATGLGSITSARLGEALGELFEIVETDLGLNETRARAFMQATVERVVTRLQADFVGGAADAAAYNRFALGTALLEVVSLVGGELDLPTLDRTTLLPAFVDRLQELGMDDRIAKAQQVTRKLSDGFTSLSALQDFIPSGSPLLAFAGAAEVEHSWYASWLKADIRKHADPTNNADLEGVDFGETLTAQTLEDVARATGFLAPMLEMGLHLRSIETGDFVSNLLNAIWHLAEGAMALFANIDPQRLGKWFFAFVASLFGGLERARFNDWFGTLLILSDMAETQLYARWAWLARETLLSTLTLLNNKQNRVNSNQIEGVAHFFGEMGNLFMALILAKTRKKDFGIPAGQGLGSWKTTIGHLMAAIGVNVFMTLVVGPLVARALAGDGADAGRVFRLLLKDRIFGRGTGAVLIPQTIASLLLHIFDFYIYYFMFADGDTSGGKLSGKPKGALVLPGYPSRTASPYRLPWNKGKIYQCAQGNHGLWSHTPFSADIEMYALDFNFNNGDEVLAMRDGVVWSFEDQNEDGDPENQNELIVLHNGAGGLPNPIAGQDFDENGTPTRTFTVYLHGKKNGVTFAFGGKPGEESAGAGTGAAVKRGQLIMLADDTGRSAYNHLHVVVKPMKADGSGPDDYTIPFVFGDADLARHGGVPRSNRWYDSDNQKVPR